MSQITYAKDIYSNEYIAAAERQFQALIDVQKGLDENDCRTGTVFPRQARLFADGTEDMGVQLYRRLVPAEEYLPHRRALGIAQEVQEHRSKGDEYEGVYVFAPGNMFYRGYMDTSTSREFLTSVGADFDFSDKNTELTNITLPAPDVAGFTFLNNFNVRGFTNSLSQIKPVFDKSFNRAYKWVQQAKENLSPDADPRYKAELLKTHQFYEDLLHNWEIFFLVEVYSKGFNLDSCGFRHHKMAAEYLGSPKYEPTHEYFYDDTNQTLYLYNAYAMPKK